MMVKEIQELEKIVDEVIELTKTEINEHNKLIINSSDVKLKEIAKNSREALEEIDKLINKNYDKLTLISSSAMMDVINIKMTVLEYRHIRITVLERLV